MQSKKVEDNVKDLEQYKKIKKQEETVKIKEKELKKERIFDVD